MTGSYCGHCGVAIPRDEIESGASRGPTGDHFCAKHRGGDATVATAQAARSPLGGVDDWEAELLFCSNCQVSIPQYDVRSGRARSEYGSMLCAVCVKATPGERASRREAVEAEMRADMEADDPLAAFQAPETAPIHTESRPPAAGPPVSAAPPPPRAPVPPPTAMQRPPPIGVAPRGPGAASTVLVAGIFLLLGFAGASLFLQPEATTAPDHRDDFARLDERLAALDARLGEVRREVQDSERDSGRWVTELKSSLAAMRNDLGRDRDAGIASLRVDVARSGAEVAQRLAKLEGGLEQLAGQVTSLATRAAQAPTVVVREAAPPADVRPDPPVGEGSEATGPTQPEAPSAEAEALMRDLLESEENGERFAAASKLGRMGVQAAIPVLAQALRSDDNYLVKRACAHALREFKAWHAAPVLIDALEDKEPSVAHAAGQALRFITGQDFGVDWEQTMGERKRRAREARNWWKSNKDAPPDGVSLHPVETE